MFMVSKLVTDKRSKRIELRRHPICEYMAKGLYSLQNAIIVNIDDITTKWTGEDQA